MFFFLNIKTEKHKFSKKKPKLELQENEELKKVAFIKQNKMRVVAT